MKKGIRAHDVRADGLKEICECCRKNSIEYIQLVLEKSIDGFEFGGFLRNTQKQSRMKLGDIKIAVLGSYIMTAEQL